MKGQTSLEFIFIILLIIVYLVTATMPLITSAKNVIIETTNIAQANNETQKIINAINEVSLGGTGTKKTITLHVPEQTTITCTETPSEIKFETTINQKPYPTKCTPAINNAICTKIFPSNTQLNCKKQNITGPAKTTATIEKTQIGTSFNAS
jgi:uncharacterized protein (UPF0333 family)